MWFFLQMSSPYPDRVEIWYTAQSSTPFLVLTFVEETYVMYGLGIATVVFTGVGG